MTKGNPAKPKQKTSTQRAQTSAKQTPAKAHKKVGEKKAKTPTAPKKAEAAKPAPTKDKKKSAPKKAEAAKPAPTKGKKKSAAKKSKGTQRRAKGCDDDEDDEDEKDKDDEDEEDDEVADPPGLKGTAAVDAYFKTKKSQSKPPSEEVLNQFEFDARAAQLMFHENTGFALDDASLTPKRRMRGRRPMRAAYD